MCNVPKASALALAVNNNGVSHFAVFTVISLRDQRVNRAKWLRVRHAGRHYGADDYVRSTMRRDQDERVYERNAHAAGMLTGTFLDDVATNEIFALDTAGPPPSPRNWLHASFHAIYSRADRPLFILVRPILIVPINGTNQRWPRGARV